MDVTLTSVPSTDQGTFGKFDLANGISYFSLELPWRNNAHGISCIPDGIYTCHWINSPKHGECYQVLDVSGRSMIEIHPANYAGDVSKQFISDLEGCIALGTALGILHNQLAVLNSRKAIAEFHAQQNKQDFKLTIRR